MGLFSKKQQPDVKQQPANEPFVVNDQTVARVAELMKMFNEAEGNFDRQHAIGGDLCSLAGTGKIGDLLRSHIDPIEWFGRPWKMLAAVTRLAFQNADHLLVAKIFGFTLVWNIDIAPQLNRADTVDVPTLDCPTTIEIEIATIALDSLKRLSSDWIIFGNTTGALTAGDIALAAANVLVHAPEKGALVDDGTLAEARRILGQNS